MRQLAIHIGTTGAHLHRGNRIVELAAVELIDGDLSGRNCHYFINPERDIEPIAQAVHGLTTEFLSDKPLFLDIAEEFYEFIQDAELIAHNATVEIGFINNELGLVGLGAVSAACPSVVDSLKLAKSLHPGSKDSLDALAARYGISSSKQNWQSALRNAELLARIYMAGFASLRVDMKGVPTIETNLWVPNVERELFAHLLRHPNALYEISPRQFEELVAAIFKNNGFSVELTPKTRDGGVDIIAVHHSALTGNSVHLIECKRYAPANKVGIGVVQRLLGTVTQRRATKGIVVTTSSFTQDAIRVAEDTRHVIALNNYNSVVEWVRTIAGAQQ